MDSINSNSSSLSGSQIQLLIDVYKTLKKDQLLFEYIKNDPNSHLSPKASDRLNDRLQEHKNLSVLGSVFSGNLTDVMPNLVTQIPKIISTMSEISEFRSTLEKESGKLNIPDETSEIMGYISKLMMGNISKNEEKVEEKKVEQEKPEVIQPQPISKSKARRNKRKNKKRIQKIVKDVNQSTEAQVETPTEPVETPTSPPLSSFSDLISTSMSLFSQFQDGKRPNTKSINKTVKQAKNLFSDMCPGLDLSSILNMASTFGSEQKTS